MCRSHLLLDVASQLGQLGLALLVELDLSCGGAAGLIQTLAELLQLAGLQTARRRVRNLVSAAREATYIEHVSIWWVMSSQL